MSVLTAVPHVLDYTQHYRCHIEIVLDETPDAGATDTKNWRSLTNLVYQWVKLRIPQEVRFWSVARFQNPATNVGTFTRDGHQVLVRTSTEESFPPSQWACRYEHPDRDGSPRRWRTDIGITRRAEGGWLLSIRVAHGITDFYYGPSLESPVPSAPSLVLNVLDHTGWRSQRGSLPLRKSPSVSPSGKELWAGLTNPARRGSMVVVAAGPTGEYPVNVMLLSKLLAGMSSVWLLPIEFQAEFDYYAGKTHTCYPASIRVYQPDVESGEPGDAVRHRYLSASAIQGQSMVSVVVGLARLVVRELVTPTGPVVFSPEDIEHYQRTERLEDLRHQLEERPDTSAEDAEYRQLLEAENRELLTKYQQLESETGQKLRDAESETFAGLVQVEELQQELGTLRFTMQGMEADTQRIKEKSTCDTVERQAALWQQMPKFPTTIWDAATLASQVWAERIVFTDRAWRSIKKADFADPQILWQGLWHLAHTLYNLYYGPEGMKPPKIIEAEFDSTASGYSLTHNEGMTTRAHPSLMRIRKDEFEGKVIDIEPHIKFGTKPPKLLRIYFAPDLEKRRFIIGHCGDHLENFTTKNLGK